MQRNKGWWMVDKEGKGSKEVGTKQTEPVWERKKPLNLEDQEDSELQTSKTLNEEAKRDFDRLLRTTTSTSLL